MLVGLLSVVAGGILVAKPSHSLATLAVVLGIFLLIDGIIELVISFGHAEADRALAAIVGLLAIVIGLLIRHPNQRGERDRAPDRDLARRRGRRPPAARDRRQRRAVTHGHRRSWRSSSAWWSCPTLTSATPRWPSWSGSG
jgi:Short repeat of unknown function (DUF308)